MAKINKRLKLTSAKKQYVLKGKIDQFNKLIKKVNIGAKIKLKVFAFVGITASFSNNFKPSAKGCNKPKKPTAFGPNRCCIAPITFRSANVKYATLIKTGNIKAKKDNKISNKNISNII
jgi:hypothetical protein